MDGAVRWTGECNCRVFEPYGALGKCRGSCTLWSGCGSPECGSLGSIAVDEASATVARLIMFTISVTGAATMNLDIILTVRQKKDTNLELRLI